ncbi:Nucleolar complex protein 2-like protein [Harpegnathos saltator]|uniref:Nucleolar complex protein 2-like protein n=1 Tax=Harpegnathos saltator TaxID=610380 RepID=E2BS53_HARSA|nr:Nucleolar complex protein 2-like protein [Harpegnathos saltator]
MSLMKLKEIDPEFYKYLQENDKNLLEFNVSDDEDDDSNASDNKHVPNENLEIASDDSDFELEDTNINEDDSKNKITLQLLKIWQEKIQTDKSLNMIKCAVDAFHAAVETVAESADPSTLRYKVEGSAVFNGVVQLCIMQLPEAFKCFLKLDSTSIKEVHKCKKFPKVQGILKTYLADLIKILQSVASANIIMVFLKHLYQMLPYTQISAKIFFSSRIKLEFFVYRENFQAVYNWQYINSLRFWTELITKTKKQSMLRSLLYPLVQIITGTIKVIPTAQYYPLRFHCVQMLIIISKQTGMFIPVLPFLLEVLDSYDFNKKHKTVSMKPVPLTCILRMSKSQLVENGFKDSVIETIYQLILENAANESHMIYFPEVYISCLIQLKAFLKKCHVSNYCRKIKQLLDKIEENRKYIETERIKEPIALKNMEEITNWENRIKTGGTEIAKFYVSRIKIHESQKLKLLTKTEEMSEYKLPVVKKSKKRELEQIKEQSEEESEFEFQVKETNNDVQQKPVISKLNKPKKKKMKRFEKNIENEDLPKEDTDIVQDINSDDWN